MAFYSHQSRKSCPNFSLFEEEPVGREPDSILSLAEGGKDYKYKRKSQAEFCIRKMGFLGKSGKNTRLVNPDC